LLEDESLKVREAVAWTFKMLSQNEDGCELIVMSESVEAMIASFIGHSKPRTMQKHDGQYLIYLLEAFVNLTFSDNGITPLLGK
jgi:hypothetical protein